MATPETWTDEDGPIATINIVPFVDVVLVLLVVFMLTSTAIVRASLVVALPKAASAGSRVESTLNLIYTLRGELLLDGERLPSWQEAGRRIRALARGNDELQAAIRADRGVEYGRVVDLIDLVKRNGVHTFALDVERVPATDEDAGAGSLP